MLLFCGISWLSTVPFDKRLCQSGFQNDDVVFDNSCAIDQPRSFHCLKVTKQRTSKAWFVHSIEPLLLPKDDSMSANRSIAFAAIIAAELSAGRELTLGALKSLNNKKHVYRSVAACQKKRILTKGQYQSLACLTRNMLPFVETCQGTSGSPCLNTLAGVSQTVFFTSKKVRTEGEAIDSPALPTRPGTD